MTIPNFEDWLEREAQLDPPPPTRETYRIEQWVLWVAVAVLVASTIASGAHNVPTIQSTLPDTWPEWLRWFVALAGFIAFDVGLFLSAYFLFFFQYRSRSQEKVNAYKVALERDPDTATMENPVDNRWVLAVGALLTIVYTVIANIHAAGNELLSAVPEWMNTVTVIGMGVIPLWAFFAGEYVARIRAFNSVAGDLDGVEAQASYRRWHQSKGRKFERLVRKASNRPSNPSKNDGNDEPAPVKTGQLTADLSKSERIELFRRAAADDPSIFERMTRDQLAEHFGVSTGTVSGEKAKIVQ